MSAGREGDQRPQPVADDAAGLRKPPASGEAEQAVLGALLQDNRCWEAVADVLRAEDFYFPVHAAIFSSIGRLINSGRPADAVTVYELGGHELALLSALSQCVPSAANARRYALIVADRSLRRQLQRVAHDLLDETFEPDDPAKPISEAADRAAGQMLELCQGRVQGREPTAIEEAVVVFIDQMNAMAMGEVVTIPTGLRDVDEATGGGGRDGELWVLGARPSMGKSALVCNIALHVAQQRGVLMLTQEDSIVTWVSRAVANRGRVNLADLRNPARARDADAMWSGVSLAVDEIAKLRLLLDDQGGLTLADVRRKAKQAKRKLGGDLGLIVVDYLQLMTGEGDNRNQMLGHIANGLKALAKEMGCWIVLLSQLSRKADETTGLPQVAHLRDSGDIEGAADVIGLLHREAQRKKTDENKHWAQLHLAKQKNGPTCTVDLYFDGKHQRFSSWEGPPPTSSARGMGTRHGSNHEGLS